MKLFHSRVTVALLWLLSSSTSVITSVSASDVCIAAYSNVRRDDEGVCNADNLSLDQLLTEPCPSECQTLYDQVLASCKVGDTYYQDIDDTFYTEEDLYVLEGQHKWASCNYGYTPTVCQRAFDLMSHFSDESPCSTDDFTIDQLLAQECPSECQALYDHVVASCRPGIDSYFNPMYDSLNPKYGEALVYHEQGDKWRPQCDYGYEPTTCDIALKQLRLSAVPDFGLEPVIPTVCLSDDNQNSCKPECLEVIDSVVSECDTTAEFSPDCCYLEKTNTRIAFEGRNTLKTLGLSGSLYSLSDICWTYYESMAPDEQSDETTPGSETGLTSATSAATGQHNHRMPAQSTAWILFSFVVAFQRI